MQPNKTKQSTIRIGIDIGGTFTDFVIFDPSTGKISTFKLPSTPDDPTEAVLAGIRSITNRVTTLSDYSKTSSEHQGTNSHTHEIQYFSIIHGSTVATNALLEHKGATTALITTYGFKDVIQIGRQNRPDLYDFTTRPPDPLVPPELRFELEERVDQFGEIIIAPKDDDIDRLISKIQSSNLKPQSIAIIFLFSFANPTHEQRVTEKLDAFDFFVSASHEILPEYREFERTSTTVVNAYVSPVLDLYLKKLETKLNKLYTNGTRNEGSILKSSISNLQIMQSNGGSISIPEARKSGVRCILSGPAGGVVGCQYIAEMLQFGEVETHPPNDSSTKQYNKDSPNSNIKLLTFDMGGTSTDVSLINGQPKITNEAEVGGFPIRVPVLDIHTIGAGGGSIASIDAGGALRVGPESAGADPGPACYGRDVLDLKSRSDCNFQNTDHSLYATVTDANLLLGRIPYDHFLGGTMPLYKEHADAAISPLAAHLGLSIQETALGIIEIANAHMERALRVISVERGHDPRQFTLLSFGGAGSLHAADLARHLGIPQLLIPPYAATLSAFGMLAADVIKDYTQTVMLSGSTPIATLKSQFSFLLDRAKNEMKAEGFTEKNIRLYPSIDMRYQGQSYELTIPLTDKFEEDFHQIHQKTYGYLRLGSNLEIVNLRVRGTGLVPSPQIAPIPLGTPDSTPALIEHRPVVMGSNYVEEIPFYQGESLKPGNQIHGPAVVVRDDTTILIGQPDNASVDPYFNLIIDIKRQL